MRKHFKNKKKFLFLLMALLSFASLPTYAFESTEQTLNSGNIIIQPRFTNISIYQNTFDLSASGKASVMTYLTVRTLSDVRVEASLQQSKNGTWTTVKSWSSSASGTSSGLNVTYYVLKGYNYRMISSGKVYKNGKLIEQTSYVSESKYY